MPAAPRLDCPDWPPAPDDVRAWRVVIRGLPVATRRALAPLFGPRLIEADAIAQRDTALAMLAIGREGSARAIAQAVHLDLARYAAGAWRFESEADAPRDHLHAAAHAVLRATDGNVLSAERIRGILRPAVGCRSRLK